MSLLAILIIGMIAMLAILAMLVMFGIVALFHHHVVGPFIGLILLLFGCYVLMGQREKQQPPRLDPPMADAARVGNDKPAAKPDSATNPPDASSDSHEPPGQRPAWVDKPPHTEKRAKDVDVEDYVTTATSGPYSTDAECDRSLMAEVEPVVNAYVADNHPDAAAQGVTLDPTYIREHLIRAQYRERIQTSVGSMQQLHVLLVFDNSRVGAEIESRLRQIQVGERLQYAAIGTSAVLLALGGLYSVLKISAPKRARLPARG